MEFVDLVDLLACGGSSLLGLRLGVVVVGMFTGVYVLSTNCYDVSGVVALVGGYFGTYIRVRDTAT